MAVMITRVRGASSLTGLLAFLAVMALVAQGGREARAPAGTPAPGPESGSEHALPAAATGSGAALLWQHLGDWIPGCRETTHGATLDTLIATVPDPFDSHLDWAFDQACDSIRRAYERAGYVMDAYWLPWTQETAGVSDENRTMREERPGVLLFRGANVRTDLQLVYLVGETPTSGVHKPALMAALWEQAILRGEFDRGPRDRGFCPQLREGSVRVVGPFFSGSATSLRRVLDQFLGSSGLKADVVTGAATSLDNEEVITGRKGTPRTFAPGCDKAVSVCGNECEASPTISFAATVHPDETLLAVVQNEVVPALGIADYQVALLTEGTTQYGAADGAGKEWVRISVPMNLISVRTDYERDWQQAAAKAGTLGARTQARVELSLDEESRPRETPRPLSTLTSAVTDLAMNELARTLDSRGIRLVVLFSTDVRDKLLLGTEIAKRLPDIQLLTTESNLLYLHPDFNASLRGMLVVSTYPQLVTDGVSLGDGARDLIFPSDGAEGIYNAVLLQLGRKDALADYRRPDAGDAGDAGPAGTAGAPMPPWPERLGELARTPPVWITVVGKSAMLPVRLGAGVAESTAYPVAVDLQNKPAPGTVKRAGEDSSARERTLPIGLTLGMVVAMFVLFVRAGVAASCLLPARVRPRRGGRPLPTRRDEFEEIGRVMHDIPDARRRILEQKLLLLHREIYEGLLVVALAALYLPGGVLLLLSRRLGTGTETIVRIGFWVIVTLAGLAILLRVALGLFTCGLVWKDWWSVAAGKRHAVRRLQLSWCLDGVARVAIIALGLGYLALSTCLAHRIAQVAGSETAFQQLARRALRIDEGASPLMPLLLIGICFGAWCCWHLRRIRLLRSYQPLEYDGLTAGAAADPDARVRRGPSLVRRRLFRVVPDVAALVLFIIFVPLGGVLWYLSQPTLERVVGAWLGLRGSVDMPLHGLWSFDWIFFGGLLVSLGVTGWAAHRFLVVWLALRNYLAELDDETMRETWKRLRDVLDRTTSLQLWRPDSPNNLEPMLARRWALVQPAVDVPAPKPSWCADTRHFIRRGQRLSQLQREMDARRKEARNGGNPVPEAWQKAAEEICALELVEWIESVLRQLRALAIYMLLSLVVVVLLLSSYPFHPQSQYRVAAVFLLAGACGALLFVIVSMNRNQVLSRVTGTAPNQLTMDRSFVSNIVLFGFLPVATLISSQVPAVRDFLFSWVDPLLKAIVHA